MIIYNRLKTYYTIAGSRKLYFCIYIRSLFIQTFIDKRKMAYEIWAIDDYYKYK